MSDEIRLQKELRRRALEMERAEPRWLGKSLGPEGALANIWKAESYYWKQNSGISGGARGPQILRKPADIISYRRQDMRQLVLTYLC